MMNLDEWQTHLSMHFGRLRDESKSAGESRPIFVLEHGLDASGRDALAAAIRADIVRGPPRTEHGLPWIVYAAEVGYRFVGDEYWQTFEQETPGWTVFGNRYWLRDRFRRFTREFGGATPEGRWAEWFSIICWPITHAILPHDLQYQMARVLYEIRHSFSWEVFEDAAVLGELIAAQSWDASSRFQTLAENPALVGQIATGLLLQRRNEVKTMIYPATLHRITQDLERERQGREWLRGARRLAEERAQARGFSVKRERISGPPGGVAQARKEVASLGIEPRMVLRPLDDLASSWEVSLEIPDLSRLLLRFPHLREVLSGSRCEVAGSAGRPLARGRCLYGTQRVPLKRWPRSDEVLLRFEAHDSYLDFLLRTECLLREGERWLFRVASDGLAYESRSLRVRPGARYVVVSTSGPLIPGTHIKPVDIKCSDVHGAQLSIPSALTPLWVETLRSLGLEQSKTIAAWPSGLAAIAWDDAGRGEWLTSERPTFAIQADHPIDRLLLSLNGARDHSIEINSTEAGRPIFVQLPLLPAGLHNLQVTFSDGSADLRDDLSIAVHVREVRSWVPGMNESSPMLVRIEPRSPTLEQLWDGHVDVEVLGPGGRTIKCRVSLFEGPNKVATVVDDLPPLQMPITPGRWRAHFESHFRKNKKAQDHYDAARVCRIAFDAEELGSFAIESERAFVPLRWSLRQRGETPVVRIIDDTGEANAPEIVFYSAERPAIPVHLPTESEYGVGSPGGLYYARQQQFNAGIVARPRIQRLADLAVTVQMDEPLRSPEAVLEAIDIAHMWGSARTSGDFLSLDRQRRVLAALSQNLMSLLGGQRWGAIEQQYQNSGSPDLTALKLAVSSRRDEAGIAAAISLEARELAHASIEARIDRLAELATSFRLIAPIDNSVVNRPRWITELALRLTSSPVSAKNWAGANARSGIAHLLDVPTLARAARFLVLATDSAHAFVAGESNSDWNWT